MHLSVVGFSQPWLESKTILIKQEVIYVHDDDSIVIDMSRSYASYYNHFYSVFSGYKENKVEIIA